MTLWCGKAAGCASGLGCTPSCSCWSVKWLHSWELPGCHLGDGGDGAMCLSSSSGIAQAFPHSSRAGLQENKGKCARPPEAWAQNWHWHFYHTLVANVRHKAIPDSRGWQRLQRDITRGHAHRGWRTMATFAIYHRQPQVLLPLHI